MKIGKISVKHLRQAAGECLNKEGSKAGKLKSVANPENNKYSKLGFYVFDEADIVACGIYIPPYKNLSLKDRVMHFIHTGKILPKTVDRDFSVMNKW